MLPKKKKEYLSLHRFFLILDTILNGIDCFYEVSVYLEQINHRIIEWLELQCTLKII